MEVNNHYMKNELHFHAAVVGRQQFQNVTQIVKNFTQKLSTISHKLSTIPQIVNNLKITEFQYHIWNHHEK